MDTTKYEVKPLYGMISQDGKTFSWHGANADRSVVGQKVATDIGLFHNCPPNMPVIDLRDFTDQDVIFSLMWNHTVGETIVPHHWNQNTVPMEEFIALCKARGIKVTTVYKVQEEATAELHTH